MIEVCAETCEENQFNDENPISTTTQTAKKVY